MVNHVDKLIEAGVTSFKIEGRVKSEYYVATVVKIYREAIDKYFEDPENFKPDPTWIEELKKVSHRDYTTGFYLGEGYPKDGYSYDISKGLAGADFLCEICDKENDWYRIKIKNKFFKNKDIEIITPSEKFITQVSEIKTLKGEELELANTNDDLWVKFTKEPVEYQYALARTIGIKGGINEAQNCACS